MSALVVVLRNISNSAFDLIFVILISVCITFAISHNLLCFVKINYYDFQYKSIECQFICKMKRIISHSVGFLDNPSKKMPELVAKLSLKSRILEK